MSYPLITNGIVLLTKKCNLKCDYCYETLTNDIMTLTTLKDIINILNDNASQMGVIPKLNFFGGEPLLQFEDLIKPACQYAKELNPRFVLTITTNGTLLTEEILNYFKFMNVNIMLSLDGHQQSHNLHRKYSDGKGSFEDINNIIHVLL